MNILAIQYTLQHKSLDIYLSGCSGINGVHCKDCHNPSSWDFNQGIKYDDKYYQNLKEKIELFDNMIDNIFILGGEPNDNNLEELRRFLNDLYFLHKKIWLFTRYSIEDVPIFELLFCDYIKTGQYMPELATDNNIVHGVKLATSNQFIYMRGLDY